MTVKFFENFVSSLFSDLAPMLCNVVCECAERRSVTIRKIAIVDK